MSSRGNFVGKNIACSGGCEGQKRVGGGGGGGGGEEHDRNAESSLCVKVVTSQENICMYTGTSKYAFGQCDKFMPNHM